MKVFSYVRVITSRYMKLLMSEFMGGYLSSMIQQ